jgi:hypothetical protein
VCQGDGPHPGDPATPQVAAVCIYADMVPVAVDALEGSNIHVAAVTSAFASGRATMAVKLTDTRDALRAGAHEIDMAIDRGAFLSGRYLQVFNVIARGPETEPGGVDPVIAGDLVDHHQVLQRVLGCPDAPSTHRGAQDVQALHRRDVPAQRVRPHLRDDMLPARPAGFSPTPRWAPPKDAREAVVAARGALKWAAATAYNRGQDLYRVAELMEGRRAQFVAEVAAAQGLTPARAGKVVSQANDRWVWYAGWSVKLAQVLGWGQPGGGAVLQHLRP